MSKEDKKEFQINYLLPQNQAREQVKQRQTCQPLSWVNQRPSLNCVVRRPNQHFPIEVDNHRPRAMVLQLRFLSILISLFFRCKRPSQGPFR